MVCILQVRRPSLPAGLTAQAGQGDTRHTRSQLGRRHRARVSEPQPTRARRAAREARSPTFRRTRLDECDDGRAILEKTGQRTVPNVFVSKFSAVVARPFPHCLTTRPPPRQTRSMWAVNPAASVRCPRY